MKSAAAPGRDIARTLKQWALAMLTPVPLVGVARLPRYFRDYAAFGRSPRAPAAPLSDSYPCLGDWTQSTPFDPHYFYQGAWLARELARSRPDAHVDVGSSVMMVSVMSAFVKTTFVDYRPLRVSLAGLDCLAGSIVSLPFADSSLGSLSCLHVIEHIGLGRYGDPVDASGHLAAASELSRVVAPGGRLYLSTPVGRERVCFNAHRIFSPHTIRGMFDAFDVEAFSFVDDDGQWRRDASLDEAARSSYGCGLFVLKKRA